MEPIPSPPLREFELIGDCGELNVGDSIFFEGEAWQLYGLWIDKETNVEMVEIANGPYLSNRTSITAHTPVLKIIYDEIGELKSKDFAIL